ncbi:MAG: hypothetical protein IQL11_09700, partial [Bacteroidales bacterium]|nr:hypothetical protein [Bacteroidales bacterium]
MKTRLLASIVLSTFTVIAGAQEITFPDLGGFKKITKYPVYVPENLWDFINGAAEGYLALGFVDLHVAEYKKGKDVIKLEIYRHSDHTMAFGIYANERSPSFRYLNLGAQGYNTDGSINFFKGNFYIKIRTYSRKEKTLQSAESLAARVEQMLPGETEMPVPLSQFPIDGKKKNEEMYINENVLGHQFLYKAFKAVYEVGPDSFSVYMIRAGTPQETWKMAEAYLKSAGMDSTESDTGKFILNDGYNGTVFLAWKNDTIVIISG